MSKTALKKQKPPAQKLENIMFSVEAGFLKRLIKFYEDEIQKSDIELFINKGELIIREMSATRTAMIKIVFLSGLDKRKKYSITFKGYNESKHEEADCLKEIIKQFSITKTNAKQKITIGIDFVKNEIAFAFVKNWTKLRVLEMEVKPGEPEWPEPTYDTKVKIEFNFEDILNILDPMKKLERAHIGIMLKDPKTKEILTKPLLVFELFSGNDSYDNVNESYTALQIKKIPYNKMLIAKELREQTLKKGGKIVVVFGVRQLITILKLLPNSKNILIITPGMPLKAKMGDEHVLIEYDLAPVMYSDGIDTCVF